MGRIHDDSRIFFWQKIWSSTTCNRRLFSSVYSRRSDSPLPSTVMILHYQWDLFGASGYIYTIIFSRKDAFCLCFLLAACCCCCWVPRAKSLESSTSRAKSPPLPLLSRKKDKSTEKRESELRGRSRVHKSSEEVIFWYSVLWRKNNSLQCWVSCVSFFLFGGRLLNKNISNDIWASFRPLLSLVFPLDCSFLN